MPSPTGTLVGNAVVAVTRGLALKTPANADATVLTRKRPEVQEGDPDQIVLVCAGDEEKVEPLYAGAAGTLVYLVTRPVTVAVAWKNAGLVDDNEPLRAWREAIWPAVTRKSLAVADGSVSWNDVNPRPEAVFDAGALRGTGYDWSLITLSVETLEER